MPETTDPQPLAPARFAEIRRRHDAATPGPWMAHPEGRIHSKPRLADVIRADHDGSGDTMEEPMPEHLVCFTAGGLGPEPCAGENAANRDFIAASWADIRDLLAALERDPWRVTAGEKPPNSVGVILRRADGTCSVGFWCEGDNEFFTGELFEKPEVYPHWMAMGDMPKPKVKP